MKFKCQSFLFLILAMAVGTSFGLPNMPRTGGTRYHSVDSTGSDPSHDSFLNDMSHNSGRSDSGRRVNVGAMNGGEDWRWPSNTNRGNSYGNAFGGANSDNGRTWPNGNSGAGNGNFGPGNSYGNANPSNGAGYPRNELGGNSGNAGRDWPNDANKVRFPGLKPHSSNMDPSLMPTRNPDHFFYTTTPRASNKPIDVEEPFEGCERHSTRPQHSTLQGDHQQTAPAPLENYSHMAVYPLMESNDPLYLNIRMPSMQYKAKIQGSSVHLLKCYEDGSNCQDDDIKSVKGRPLISPLSWNYIYSQIHNDKIIIGVNEQVRVMTMNEVPSEDLQDAEWLVSSGTGFRNNPGDVVPGVPTGPGNPEFAGVPFIVQFPCAEYKASHLPSTPSFGFRTDSPTHPGGHTTPGDHHHLHSTPAPHVGYTTESTAGESDDSTTNAVIVGVLVAIVLLVLIIAISVSVYKKRSGFKVNEGTPLSDSSAATQQVTQQTQ